MYQVVVVTEDGQQVTFGSPADAISTRREKWSASETDEQVRKYDIGVELSNRDVDNILPGAKGTRVLIAEGEVPSVKRVFVFPAGGFLEAKATRTD
jgi:hypothetical protein